MGAEHFDETLVFGAVLLQALELEARRPESARRRVPQRLDGGRRLETGVYEVFGERADDAVTAGIDLADVARIAAGRFDDPGGRGIDDRGHPAGLGIKGIARTVWGLHWSTGSGRGLV